MNARNPRVFLSGRSRRGKEAEQTIRDTIAGNSEFIVITENAVAFQNLLEDAKRDKCTEVWVGGGDGTVRLAAQSLAGSDITLGILPLGTGNSLARELGIPLDPSEAVEFLFNKAVCRPIDLGDMDGEVFVNVATFGITSGIVDGLNKEIKKRFGRLAYLPAVVQAVAFSRSHKAFIETPEESFAAHLIQFVAANSRLHSGPLKVTPDARIDDGLVSAYGIRANDKRDLPKIGFALLRGKHTYRDDVWSTDVQELKITLNKPATFILDGDKFERQTATFKIRQNALKVLAKE
jgi:YegS/Rv2252/BmrU family lipid kinase